MDDITINAELQHDDWLAYQRVAHSRVAFRDGRSWLIPMLLYALLGIGTAVTFEWLNLQFSLPSYIAGLLLIAVLMIVARRRTLKNHAPRNNGAFIGTCTYTFNSQGITTQRATMSSRCGWQDVIGVTRDERHVYFWIDTTSAFVLPTRCLKDLSVDTLLANIDRWREPYATADRTIASAQATRTSSERSAHWAGTWLKLLTLRNVPARDIPSATAAIAIPAGLALSAELILDRYTAGTPAVFYGNNLPVLGLYALMTLVVAWVFARMSVPAVRFGQTLFVTSGALPVFIVAMYAISYLSHHPWSMVWCLGLGLYALLYAANALHRLSDARQPKAILMSLGIMLIFGAADSANFWTPTLWYPPEDEYGDFHDDPTWTDSESLLFEQQHRIDAALSHIPSSDTASNTFFLGFAGVAEQKVFAEEIALAARVIGNRYHDTDRSLRLVNDRRDRNSLPLATVSNLHYALQGLAKKMDVEHDVLFLALSSHGDDAPSLQVSNGYLSLQQVTGDNLAEALRDSGIKWRIIVISACHAGAFIEPLKDPRTIIITAAAADKTSFGCADDRDLTYFGEAFYRDALPQAASLEDAFAKAKTAIAKRERREHIEASNPQAYFGAEISRKLHSS